MDWILIHSSAFGLDWFQALCWVLGPWDQTNTLSILKEQEGGPREDLQQDVNITCENWAQGWTQQKDRLTLCGEDHIWVSQRRRFCRVTYWDQGMSMPM